MERIREQIVNPVLVPAAEKQGYRIMAGGPGAVPDFTPFFQRAKDEKPDVLYVFVPVCVPKTQTRT
jgi:hypothetical protein